MSYLPPFNLEAYCVAKSKRRKKPRKSLLAKVPAKCLKLSPGCIIANQLGRPISKDYVLQPGDTFLVVCKPKT